MRRGVVYGLKGTRWAAPRRKRQLCRAVL